MDYLSDLIYLLDLVVVKYRIIVMKNGFWVKDKKELSRLQKVEHVIFVKVMVISQLHLTLVKFINLGVVGWPNGQGKV